MVNLYLNHINYSISNFEEQLATLPLLIQQRIRKKKQQKKQIASLHGYKLLQQLLKDEYHLSLDTLFFNPSGKPALKNCSVEFNISHSKELVGVVASNLGAVGLDIEPFRKFDSVETAFSFFSLVEQKAILTANNPNEKLIEFWSKKEALIKLLGSQMFDIASQTDVRFSSTIWLENKYFFHQITPVFDNQIWIIASFSIDKINTKKLFS